MFPRIQHIDDLRPHVAHKKEMRFLDQANGTTVACYQFSDHGTFDSVLALECRGITFGPDGSVISRPLHKFFNLGERPGVLREEVIVRDDVVGVYDKLDGSMIATAWMEGGLHWRSKQSFGSDVVKLAQGFLADPAQADLLAFATEVAQQGWTAIFELTHPEARIVVDPGRPQLRLLHVRDNVSGAYLLLDASHRVHDLVRQYGVPCVVCHRLSLTEALAALDGMTGQEGFVVQFANGDMVKLKCDWYQRLHRSVTFLRERDIAELALTQGLDDIKGALAETGIDMAPILDVESRVKARLIEIVEGMDALNEAGRDMDIKTFAVTYSAHPLFHLAMTRHRGREIDVAEWFVKHRLREEFSLRVLASGAVAEAMAG